ncbi:MAG: hypothetical protein IPP83_04520 [Flavobacteriales bacterium]|nr:hypothetical protein [Flavobacteriales bacterium]
MSENSPAKQRMDLAFAALLSDDDAQALTALTRIETQGDARAIPPLLTALAKGPSSAVQQRITSLLYQVKAKDAVPTLLTSLEDEALHPVRTTILATFWNAGLDVRDHLDRFIDIAIVGSAHECFECLTVIENQEIWPEKTARLGLARVRKAATSEADAYKRSMLEDLTKELEGRLGVSA